MYRSCSILPTLFSPSCEIPGLGHRRCAEDRAAEVDTTYHCPGEHTALGIDGVGEWLQTRAGCSEYIDPTNTASVGTRFAFDSWHLDRSRARIWHYANANEDYGFVCEADGWLQHSCQLLSPNPRLRYLTVSDKRTQNHGYVVMHAAANFPAIQHEAPLCRTTHPVCISLQQHYRYLCVLAPYFNVSFPALYFPYSLAALATAEFPALQIIRVTDSAIALAAPGREDTLLIMTFDAAATWYLTEESFLQQHFDC
ncbi:hypothetical protein EDD85DRAFT_81878 [Armillaria nabsnona]|nr:hypothetical protein EDD85DRAFT_81878 [Armillaria nabsnona]